MPFWGGAPWGVPMLSSPGVSIPPLAARIPLGSPRPPSPSPSRVPVPCPPRVSPPRHHVPVAPVVTVAPAVALFSLVGFVQMAIWAQGKHRSYLREFRDYPPLRSPIIPFLL